MSVDWETVRLARRTQRDLDDFDKRAAEQVKRDKAEYLARREREQHQADLAAYASFASSRAVEASKRNDPDDERVWSLAASHARAGKWLVHRTVSADCRIPQFQSLRSRLCCDGQTAQIEEK